MKARIFAIAVFVIIILATAGCLQAPSPGDATQLPTTSVTPKATLHITAVTIPTTTERINDGTLALHMIDSHHVGDRFTINGTTNLAPGNALLVEIISSSFGPTNKSMSGQFYGTSGIVYVTKGGDSERNVWSFEVDTSGRTETGFWVPDLYQVTISGIAVDVETSSSFMLLPIAQP